jgi:mRNA interferase MazF
MKVERGDVFLVNFNPGRGSEQAGHRPALVIQNNVGNQIGSTTIVAAITTTIKKAYPFMVRLEAGEGGLDRESVVNLAQILTIDKDERLNRKLGSLSQEKMVQVNNAIKISLALS